MRVLFLDIDGVLNSRDWITDADNKFTDPWPGPRHVDWEDETPETRAEYKRLCAECQPAIDEHVRKHHLSMLNPVQVRYLNPIVEATECVICVISSWRIICSVEEIASLCAEHGFRYPKKFIARTSDGCGGHRGEQIREWVTLCEQPIDGIVVLEDEGRIEPFDLWQVKPEFWEGGMKEHHVQECIDMLLRPFAKETLNG